MRINNNIHALNAYRNLSSNQFALGRNMEKLSSGLRINRAADDAAGLAISEKMRSQIRGLEMAERNSLNGISLIQTAEGALNEVHSMLQRMKELAVQAANETNDIADRREIQKEINQLLDEIDRISNDTEFNTKKLLDGNLSTLYEVEGANPPGLPLTVTSGSHQLSFQLPDGTSLPSIDIPVGVYTNNAAGLTDLVNAIQSEIDKETDLVAAGIKVDIDSTGNNLVFSAKEELSISGNALGDLGHQNTTLPQVRNGIALQIGANENQQLRFEINELSTKTLGFGAGTIAYDPADNRNQNYSNLASLRVDPALLETATSGGVLTNADAGKAMTIIERAIQQTSSERSKMGAIQNRLEHAINNLSTTRENLTAAESRIRDADMAKEMTEFTKNNIKNQAATAMLAQANQLPQGVLQLLQ